MQNKISIYAQLANKYKISPRIIEVMCNHPFMFANKIIADDTNEKALMFSYLFKIKKKKRYLNEEPQSIPTPAGTV